MAATRVEAQQSDSKYEKTHEDQPQDIVFHNGRENARGIIFCDTKSLSKSKTSGQNSIDTDMSQYRSETGAVVSVQNSASDEQNAGNSSLESSKKNRDGKSVKHNSEQSSSGDQHCTKVSDSGQNMQMYNMGLPGRANYHPDHRVTGLHSQSNTEGGGLPQHPFSHLRPMNRHNFHSSKPVPSSPVMPSRPVGAASSGPPGGVPSMQPKLFSGQSISQQTGPTPTLNQLLQSSHPLQRHQNSYSEFALQKSGEQGPPVGPYHQMWSPHQSSAPCNPHSVCYRGQAPSPRGHLVPGAPGSYPQHQQHISPGPRQDAEGSSPIGAPYVSGASLAPPQQSQHPYLAAGSRYPAPSPNVVPVSRGEVPQQFSSHSLSPPFAQPQSIAISSSASGSTTSSSSAGSSSGVTCTSSAEQRPWGQLPHPPHQSNTPAVSPHNSHVPQQGSTPSQHTLSSSQLSPSQNAPPQSSPSRSSPHQHSSHFQSTHPPQSHHQIQPPQSPGSIGHPSSQLSPQSSSAQRCSPQKQHGHQTSPQVPLLRQESSNADAPDVGDLTGQNSNDSTSGPGAPGTPNSQGMRPTPSPTGSTGSRSMSPAVGQQNIPMPPRPSSGQSDGSGPARMSHSPMATPGGYQQPLGPPHMHSGYKLGSHPPGIVPPTGQQMGPYTPPSQQYSQGNYSARPQGQLGNMQYGPTHGYGQQNPQGNSLGAGQYPNRPMPNHVPHSQFGGYQGWGSPGIGQGPPANAVGTPGNQMPPKGPGPGPGPGGPGSGPQPPNAPAQGTNASTGPRSLTPPHYLKQHLQHKMGYGTSVSSIPPSPGSLQVGYGGSPSVSSNSGVGVGPNPSMGPGVGSASGIHHHGPGTMNSPMGPPASGHLHPGMGPPAPNMGPPGPSGMGPGNPGMGPPSSGTSSSTNNTGPMAVSSPSAVLQGTQGPPVSTSVASPVPNSHHDGPMPPPITSSNSSLSHPPPSGQVPGGSHPEINSVSESPHDNGIAPTTTVAGTTATNVTPATSGTVTSVVTTGPDGAPLDEGSQQSTLSNASQASGEDQNCTPKSRKDGSVVGGYHSHPPTPQSTVPSPGAASLNSVHEEYDVNSPSWPRTPASPVSLKPDSLCKLYEMDDSHDRRMWLDKLLQFMEERGTPISACPTISKNPLDLFRLYLYVKERGGFMEVTKNKTWKDIAGLLGIGASSSAAYTLRKHYMKNLLAFECHFDRGNIDPQTIINQVEATSKKKGGKAASVPSPGSSNSQDSFPAAGSSTSMDGFTYGYPPGSTPDFNTPPLNRPSQTNAPSPHPGMQQGYQGQGGYSQYPQDQYGRSAPSSLGQDFNQQYSPSGSYPTNRGMYTPYGPDAERNYSQGSSGNQPSAGMQQSGSQDPYRYMAPSQPPVYPARAGYGGPPAPPTGPNNQQQPPAGYPGQQDYYRQDQVYPGGQPPASGGPAGQMYPAGPHNKSMPPPAPQPRRHPDFAKDQPQPPYPQYGPQQRQPVYGWSGNNTPYRGQFPPQGPVPQGSQQWPQGPPRPAGPPGAPGATGQWEQRYPPAGQSAYQQSQQSQQQWVPNMATPGVGQSSPLRTPIGVPRGPYRPPEGKPFPISTPPGGKGHSGGMPVSSQYPAQSTPKREIVFPPDSVEATMPVLYKRKRMTRTDVSPVEAWRLMMSLRSGLLAESCWALDVLNILLFDDSTVAYFGLAHMPGLLDVLLEHFRRSLADMFDAPTSTSLFPSNSDDNPDKWYHRVKMEPSDVDLGSVVTPVDPEERVCLLQSTVNYTLHTRKGEPVKIVNKDSDIFVLDNRKVWDVDGDVAEENVTAELEQDQWQLATSDNSTTKYIVTCFQGEFGNVPFVRVLSHKRLTNDKEDAPNLSDNADRLTELSVGEEAVSVKSVKAELEPESDNASEKSGAASKEENTNSQDCVFSSDRKNCDKKKRTNKSLSEVLSRIKKEPVEMNDILTREIRDKVEKSDIVTVVTKDEPNTSDITEQAVDVDSSSKGEKVSDSIEDGVNGLSFENGTSSNNSNDSDKINEEGEESMENIQDQMLKTEEKKEDSPEPSEESNKPTLNIRDPAGTLKRRRMSDYEDECYTRDEASLYLVTDTQDALARRCVCLSNILRNLTFVPGNEVEFAKNPTFLGLLGKLLLLHHEHPARTAKQRNYDREEDADFGDSCSSLQGESEWWWDFLHHIRENALVTAANIAGHMDLGQYPEEISRPVLDGLLHWAVCPAAHGQDPFPTVSSFLSPQRLALEALCKLCVTENNVDLVIATPPYSRLERLCAVLTKLLCRGEEQVLREFAVNLLHYLAAADSGVARTVALQSPCVSLLVAFIEQAEASALGVANQHGIGALRDNPDSMGTSLDMLRRAAGTLLHLARHPDNRPLFLQQEQRLLALVMSQILDHQVASIISRVLFQCSRSLLEHGNSYTS